MWKLCWTLSSYPDDSTGKDAYSCMSFISELPEIISPLEETFRYTVSDEDNNRFLQMLKVL